MLASRARLSPVAVQFLPVLRLSYFIQFAGRMEHSQLQPTSGRTVLLTQRRFFQGSVLCLCSWVYFWDDSHTSRRSSGRERALEFVEPLRKENSFVFGKGPIRHSWEASPHTRQDYIKFRAVVHWVKEWGSSTGKPGLKNLIKNDIVMHAQKKVKWK